MTSHSTPEQHKKWRDKNSEHVRAYRRKYRASNLGRIRETERESARKHAVKKNKTSFNWYHDNREYALEKARQYRLENAEQLRTYKKEWCPKNKGLVNACVTGRKKKIRQATPDWLTREHHRQITEFYILSAASPEPTHVDHVIPIDGKKVCGLHVPWNLQILPALENLRKRSKIPHQPRRVSPEIRGRVEMLLPQHKVVPVP